MKTLNEEEFLEVIVSRLVKIREERGLTQKQVYDDTGVNIGRFERSKTSITMTKLNIICEYYDIPMSQVFKI